MDALDDPGEKKDSAARGSLTKTDTAPPAASMGKVSAPELKLPPRPEAPEGEAEALSTSFVESRQQFDALMGEQNSKLMELKVNSQTAIETAVQRLEDEARRCRQLIERNETLAREAERLVNESRNLERVQDELEQQIRETSERCHDLAERTNVLREQRAEHEAARSELEKALHVETEALAEVKAEYGILKQREETVHEENQKIEQKLSRLQDRVAKLERVREEFMSEMKRAQGSMDELMNVPMTPTPGEKASARAGEDGGPAGGGDDKPGGDKPGGDKPGAGKPSGFGKP